MNSVLNDEIVRKWTELLKTALTWQGILQEREPGCWRLRWRERIAGSLRHRSRAVPLDELELVRALMGALRKWRAGERTRVEETRAQFRQYRQRRREVWRNAPGGRDSKRDALRIYDALMKNRSADVTNLLMVHDLLARPRKRGRPAASIRQSSRY